MKPYLRFTLGFFVLSMLWACSDEPAPTLQPQATVPWRVEGGAAEVKAGVNYLSDLEIERAYNGWGPLEKDRSNGEAEAGDGRTLTINARSFKKGLGVHPGGNGNPAKVRYDLDARCDTFAAQVGVDDEVDGRTKRGSVSFAVVADGEELWRSARLTGQGGAVSTGELDISGVKKLELIAEAGQDNRYDHANWADARVTCLQGKSAPSTAGIQARKADDLVDSVGTVAHWTFEQEVYFTRYEEVRDALAESGIRNVRAGCGGYDEQRRHLELWERHGTRLLVAVDGHWGDAADPEKVDAYVEDAKTYCDVENGQVIGFHGLNEWDQRGNAGPSANWVAEYRAWQRRLYQTVKNDPELKHLPVGTGPLAHTDAVAEVGDVSAWADFGTDHTYPGACCTPRYVFYDETLDYTVDELHAATGPKPVWVTETGYSTDDLSLTAQAKLTPRLFALYFGWQHRGQAWVAKTFQFQFAADDFGLVDERLTKRPAYYALINTIALLEEATWDRAEKTWRYPTFTPEYLDFTLTGDTEDVEQLLLQKSDGRFYLLLWQAVSVWDADTRNDVRNPTRELTLELKGGNAASVRTYLPLNETDPAAPLRPTATTEDTDRVVLNVPDHLMIVEITP